MFGVLKRILGAGDTIKAGFELIDKMHTSDEESIKAKNQARVDLLNAYAPFKLAQRYLALMFGCTYLLCFVLTLVFTLAGSPNASKVIDVMGAFSLGVIMLVIVSFYFGGGAFEGALKARAEGKRNGS